MDIFTKYNRKNIQDRQVDTLIGLGKGLIADGVVNQSEAEFLLTWLIQNGHLIDNPIILNLLEKVSDMLEDGTLDQDESAELLGILQTISGEHSEIGELAKPSLLPIDLPLPNINFNESKFLFTGTFAFGNRRECQTMIEQLGGKTADRVTKSLDVLVIGSYVTDSWVHETFGRKIEKAMEYRDKGLGLAIITEQHWLNEAGI